MIPGSGGETLPAFSATRLECGAPGAGLHSVPESVTTLPSSNLRLVSPLHEKPRGRGGSSQVTEPEKPMSKHTEPGSRRIRTTREKNPNHLRSAGAPGYSPPNPGNLVSDLGLLLWKYLAIIIHTGESRALDSRTTPTNTRSTQPGNVTTSSSNQRQDGFGPASEDSSRGCTQTFPQVWTNLWTNSIVGRTTS